MPAVFGVHDRAEERVFQGPNRNPGALHFCGRGLARFLAAQNGQPGRVNRRQDHSEDRDRDHDLEQGEGVVSEA